MSRLMKAALLLILVISILVAITGVALALKAYSEGLQAQKVYYNDQSFLLEPSQVDGLKIFAVVRGLGFGPYLAGEMEVILPQEVIAADFDFGGVPQAKNNCDVTIRIWYKDKPIPATKIWKNCPTVGEMNLMFRPTDIKFPTIEH